MTMLKHQALIQTTHPSWHAILDDAFCAMDTEYLQQLNATSDWLPGKDHLLAAFLMPLASVQYLLLGESPYPRRESANGYAFWDNAVASLWSERGLSKAVNRATSLRNLLKMLLYARGDLTSDFSQEAIASLDHRIYHQTAEAMFMGLVRRGFLLLNASLVYEENNVPHHARMWRPFISCVLRHLASRKPAPQLLLFGRIARLIPEHSLFNCLLAEHPYNLSFITHPHVVNFFKPLDVLINHE